MSNSIPCRLPSSLPYRPRPAAPLVERFWNDTAGIVAEAQNDNAAAADDRYETVWQEHVPHTGRRPPQKGVANFRGVTADADRNEIVLESTLEHAAASIALADPKVVRLKSQVGRIEYTDKADADRHTTFDFVATTVGGIDTAIAIKPERRRAASKIDETVQAAYDQHPGFVNEVAVWTEANLPRYAEHNAGVILRSRKLRDDDDVAAMRGIAETTVGAVHLGHFLRAFGSNARGFAAAVNLIDDGILVPVQPGRIQPELKVRYAA